MVKLTIRVDASEKEYLVYEQKVKFATHTNDVMKFFYSLLHYLDLVDKEWSEKEWKKKRRKRKGDRNG